MSIKIQKKKHDEIISKYRELISGKVFEELMELKGIHIPDLKRFESDATTEITAYYVDTSAKYDNYSLHFIFIYDNSVYGFVHSTPYDELHRAYGRMSGDKLVKDEWYDNLVENTSFQICINPDNPAQFYITDKRFYPMNSWITFIGKWDMQLKKNTITYEARKLGIPRYKFDYLRGRIGFWNFIFEFPQIIKSLIRRIRHIVKYEREYIREKGQKNTGSFFTII